MSDIKFGQKLRGLNFRDCTHIAVAPIILSCDMKRGERFKFLPGSSELVISAEDDLEAALGIIDPFFEEEMVEAGSNVWGLIMPGTIKGMRHYFIHEAFPDEIRPDKEIYRQNLMELCDKYNLEFENVIDAVQSDDADYRYITAYDSSMYGPEDLGDDYELFWDNIEGYTGIKYDDKFRDSIQWTCSC